MAKKTTNKSARAIDKRTAIKAINNLKEGDTFVDEDGYKCHVVTNLKKEGGGYIVFKYFGKGKQWWHYFIQPYFWFEIRLRMNGGLKIKSK